MSFLTKLIRVLMVVGLVTVSLLTFIQVVFRNMDISISGYDELIGINAIWVYFLGMALASALDSHIKGGMDELITHQGFRKVLGVISHVALLAFSIISLYISIRLSFIAYAKAYATIYFSIPVVFSLLALVVGFTLNIFFVIHHLLGSTRKQ